MDLENKVAVITGASSGIGKASAQMLSEKKCKTVLASRSIEELAKIKQGLPSESIAVKMDVSDSASVKKLFRKI